MTDLNLIIDNAVVAHLAWLKNLENAIKENKSDVHPDFVRSDKNCILGKWLYESCPKEVSESSIYGEVKILHTRFHIIASEILQLALSGDKDIAEVLLHPYGEFVVLSGQLILNLKSLKKDLKY